MSPTLAVILFVVFFALMIILSDKLKMSIGLLGVLFAISAAGLEGFSMAVVGYFPTNTIITPSFQCFLLLCPADRPFCRYC